MPRRDARLSDLVRHAARRVITGYVDRVLGAGLTPKAIRSGDSHHMLQGKQLVLLTTSGSTLPWLAERGQWHGLREAFDFYLESIFSFGGCEHEHFDSIVSPLLPAYAAECLGRAQERARLTCSAVLAEMRASQKRAKLSMWGGALTRSPDSMPAEAPVATS